MNKTTSTCGHDDGPPEAIQRALCIIGDKWTALILHNLHDEPKRFKDFRDELTSLNPRTLTQRLNMLIDEDIIEKKHFDEPSACTKYLLTQKGRDLDEVIHDMARWGQKYSSAKVQS